MLYEYVGDHIGKVVYLKKSQTEIDYLTSTCYIVGDSRELAACSVVRLCYSAKRMFAWYQILQMKKWMRFKLHSTFSMNMHGHVTSVLRTHIF